MEEPQIVGDTEISLNTIHTLINETQHVQPLFDGGTHISSSLCRSMAWVGAGAAIRALQEHARLNREITENLEHEDPTVVDQFREEKLEDYGKTIQETENKYETALRFYAHFVKKMPETQRRLDINGNIISVIPVDMVTTMTSNDNSDLHKELDFNDTHLKFVMQKLKKSEAVLKQANANNIKAAEERRAERVVFVESVKLKLINDMTDALNREEEDFDINEDIYQAALKSLDKKIGENIVKGVGFMVSTTSSLEVKDNAMSNDPILEYIRSLIKATLRKFEENQRTSDRIYNDEGEAIIF